MRVYRLIFNSKNAIGIHEVQRKLALSSPSVAQYHLRKLVDMGLVREDSAGYVLDRVVFANILRVRSMAIPVQSAYVAFFAASLSFLLVFLRPAELTSIYVFAIFIAMVGLLASVREVLFTHRQIS